MHSIIKGIVVFLVCFCAASAHTQPIATTSLPESYYGHSLAATAGFLYHVGGLGGINGVGSAQKVFYAPLQAEGAIGSWTEASALPRAVFFHSGIAADNTLYVLGGYNFENSLAVSNRVYFSRLNADGSPGAWQETAALPEAVFFLSAAIYNGRIYVTGGWNGQALSNAVYSALIQPDSSLGPWTAQRPLPEGIYTHAAVSNGALYVLGGAVNGGTQIQNTVYYSLIGSDGTLAGWNATTPLPLPLSNHAAVIANGHVFTAGGWIGAAATPSIFEASVNGDSSLGGWSTYASLPQSLYLSAGAATSRYFYISGGTDGQSPKDSVYSMALPDPPPPPPLSDLLAPRSALAIGVPRYGTAPIFTTTAALHLLTTVDDYLQQGDGLGSVAETLYSLSGSSWTSYGAPFSVTQQGLHELSFFSVDKAGNTEQAQVSSLAVDAAAPVSELAVGAPRAYLSSGDLIISPLTPLSVGAQDPAVNGVAVGVSQILSAVDSDPLAPAPDTFNIAGEGAHTVLTQAADHLGNLESARAWNINVDGTAPLTTLSVSAGYFPPNDSPILNAASFLNFSALDPVSGGCAAGVHHSEYSTDAGAPLIEAGPFTLEEGAHVISYRSIDNVGNAEAAKSASYRVDATPPLSALEIASPALSLFGMEVMTPQTPISLTAQDPVSNGVSSGVERIIYSVDGGPDQIYSAPFNLAAGSHDVSFGSADNAGNLEERNLAKLSVTSFLSEALAGVNSVTLSGQAQVTGDVRSNGPFKANGKSRVDGNVTALSVTLTGQSRVSGSVSETPGTIDANAFDLVAAKAAARADNNNAAIPSKYLSQGALELEGAEQLTLSSGSYYLTGLKVSALAGLSVSGEVQLFISGEVAISGLGRVNESGDAADLWIISDLGAVGLSGAARAAFNLYAPRSAVSISGLGQFAGHVLGEKVALSGKALQPSTRRLPGCFKRGKFKHLAIVKRIIQGLNTSSNGHLKGKDWAVALSRITLEIAPTAAAKAQQEARVARSSGIIAAPPAAPLSLRDHKPAIKGGKKSAPALKPVFYISPQAALSFVNAQGHEVRSKNQSAVVIPPGAVASGLGVTVCPAKAADKEQEARRLLSTLRQAIVPAAEPVEFGPEGARFEKSVTIELPYNRLQLGAGVSDDNLAVHYWNPKSGEWEILASEVDKQAQIVRAKTDHFSLYQVFSGAGPEVAAPALGFVFGQVYAFPNPSRPGQNPSIHVEAGSADNIEIRIYDLSGELRGAASLSGPRNPFEYAWNVSGVGSGVYIYVVTASKNGVGSMRKTGRLAVIK